MALLRAPLDYFALLVGAGIVGLFSGVVATLCVKFEERGLAWFWAACLLWFCTGGCVLLGEVAVKSGISIYSGPHGPHGKMNGNGLMKYIR